MRRVLSRVSLFVALLGAPAIVGGCSSAADPDSSYEQESFGSLRLPLRGFGASGAQYRLRQALISVTGPTARLHDTETDPDLFSLVYEVPAGHYEIQLSGQAGPNSWQLERLSEDTMTWSNVDATLAPPNPIGVDVLPDGSAFVNLQFVVDSDEVVLGTGQLFINLSVEDRPQCTPFVSPSTCLSGQKCLSVFAIQNVAVCQPAGMVPMRGSCTQDNDCADGHCWFFGDDHTECLPDCVLDAEPGELGACPTGAFCSTLTTSVGTASVGACFFF